MRIPALFDLTGKVALVTGANSGIGGAMAEALAEAGAAVVLVARRAAELETACKRIASSGGKAASIACDLTDRAAIADCASKAGLFRRAGHPRFSSRRERPPPDDGDQRE